MILKIYEALLLDLAQSLHLSSALTLKLPTLAFLFPFNFSRSLDIRYFDSIDNKIMQEIFDALLFAISPSFPDSIRSIFVEFELQFS